MVCVRCFIIHPVTSDNGQVRHTLGQNVRLEICSLTNLFPGNVSIRLRELVLITGLLIFFWRTTDRNVFSL
jgi:hypothetical protein